MRMRRAVGSGGEDGPGRGGRELSGIRVRSKS